MAELEEAMVEKITKNLKQTRILCEVIMIADLIKKGQSDILEKELEDCLETIGKLKKKLTKC